MISRMKLLLVVNLFMIGSVLGCPAGFDYVKGKCYKLGPQLSRELARESCHSEDVGDHLWIIDSIQEFDNVIAHFFPQGNGHERNGVSPGFWTDGIFNNNGSAIWEENLKPVTVELDQGVNTYCCLADGCSDPNFVDGSCITVGMWDYPGPQGYVGLTGCSCQETVLPYICETADTGDFDCPDDGQFASAPCSEMFWDCFGGIATPEYCQDGFVFNEEAGYCDFPENVPACQETTEAPMETTTSGTDATTQAMTDTTFGN